MSRVGAPVPALRAAVFPSNLGWMAVVWHEGRVHRIAFGHPCRQAALAAVGRLVAAVQRLDRLESTLRDLVERLQALAVGTPDDFLDVELDLSDRTAFQRAVLEQCRRIPRGQVSTYSQLAARAGFPGAARAVGNVLAANRVPLIVPCHRVVGASGKLGGFSAPQGLDMKRQLLQLEGALVRGS
ncbi:MAG: MGMT family protein [Planctomycetaceae bacterium]|nr:MGMT family protein [Planctomycetaceae bacterium]